MFDCNNAAQQLNAFRLRQETAKEIGERFNKMETDMARMQEQINILQNKLDKLTRKLK